MGDGLFGPKPKVTPTGPSIGPVSPRRLVDPLVPWQVTGVAPADALPSTYRAPAPIPPTLFPQQDATAQTFVRPDYLKAYDDAARALLRNAIPLKPALDRLHDVVDEAATGGVSDPTALRAMGATASLGMSIPMGPEGAVARGLEELSTGARSLVRDLSVEGTTKMADLGHSFAIVSGELGHLTPEENAIRSQGLAALLRDGGHEPIPVTGQWKNPATGQLEHEQSFLVPGMTEREARRVGARFGQQSVLTEKGVHTLADNTTRPFRTARPAISPNEPQTVLPNGKSVVFEHRGHLPEEEESSTLPADYYLNGPTRGQGVPESAPMRGKAPTNPTLNFEHYSPQENLTELHPNAMGAPGGLGVKAEQQRASRGGYDLLPRSYAYVQGGKPEDRLVGLPKYTGSLPSSKVADIATMPDILKMAGNREDFERELVNRGYAGYRNTQSAMPHALALFENTPVTRVGEEPRVLGSSPGNAFRPKPIYHGTMAEGFDVPTRGDVGVHFGTREQALNRINDKFGGSLAASHSAKVAYGQDLVDQERARLLKFYPTTRYPLLTKDAGGWHIKQEVQDVIAAAGVDPERWRPIFGSQPWTKQIRQTVSAAGYDSINYPNAVEGPGLSSIIFNPEHQLSKTPPKFGGALSEADVRGLGVEGAHHLVSEPLSQSQWADRMAQQFPHYAAELRGDAGARAFVYAQKKADSIGPLSSFEHINNLAHSATGEETRNWYAGWWPKISGMLGDHDADMLTRFSSILSAQKSPSEEARLALTAFGKYQDALDAQGVAEDGSLYRQPNWAALGTTPQREQQLTAAANGQRWAKSAPKTSNYYLARRGSQDAVTIDRHIARAYRGTDEISDEHYPVLAARLRHDAARAGVSPRDYQAMVWGGQTGYAYRPPESFFAEHLGSGDFGPLLERNPGLRELANAYEPEEVRAPALRLRDDPHGRVFDGAPGETHDEAFHRLAREGLFEDSPQVRANLEDAYTTNWGRHVRHPGDVHHDEPPF